MIVRLVAKGKVNRAIGEAVQAREGMIPQQIIDEATQYKDDCIGWVNDPNWMATAASYFKDCAIRDSQRSVEDLSKDKWSYLEYRANMHDTDCFGNILYGDKPARAKYLAIVRGG